MARIAIHCGDVHIQAELNDSPCAGKILEALPIAARANTWGDEIYFDIGVSVKLTPAARELMDVGEIAYWPPGKAMCLFLGPTPVSESDGRPRAASPVVPIGRIVGEAGALRSVQDGDPISITMPS